MSNRPTTPLDEMIGSARERVDIDGVWSASRQVRVREGALRRHDVRVRRGHALRRAALVAGGAGLLVLALLTRVAGGSTAASASAASAVGSAIVDEGASTAPAELGSDAHMASVAPEQIAALRLGDAGYARD